MFHVVSLRSHLQDVCPSWIPIREGRVGCEVLFAYCFVRLEAFAQDFMISLGLLRRSNGYGNRWRDNWMMGCGYSILDMW